MAELSSSVGDKRIAMLIDGDNAQSSLIGEMIAEAGKYGLVTIRRVYGDWTTSNMKSWKDQLNAYAVQPIQQFRYTTGKNATDSALIIDAMDILYERVVNSFCLVSSDSDYTRLATRIREKGLFVMGIGERKTPRAFVNGCDLFVFTENLRHEVEKPAIPARTKQKLEVATGEPDLLTLLKNAIDMATQEDGWAFLGAVGSRLLQLDPSFDTRTYGYRQLSELIKAHTDELEIKENKGKGGTSAIYIRPRDVNPQ